MELMKSTTCRSTQSPIIPDHSIQPTITTTVQAKRASAAISRSLRRMLVPPCILDYYDTHGRARHEQQRVVVNVGSPNMQEAPQQEMEREDMVSGLRVSTVSCTLKGGEHVTYNMVVSAHFLSRPRGEVREKPVLVLHKVGVCAWGVLCVVG